MAVAEKEGNKTQKFYNTDEAVTYLAEHGFTTTKGTLAVWRCKKTGPSYVKLRSKPLYHQESLDAFLGGGVHVKTMGSMGAR